MAGSEKWFGWLLFLALCRPGWHYFGLGTWSCFSSPHESPCPHWYPTKKQSAFSNRSLHKKAWSSIIWGYFQPYLWSSLTWSHTEAKAGAAIILPPHGMSLLLMFFGLTSLQQQQPWLGITAADKREKWLRKMHKTPPHPQQSLVSTPSKQMSFTEGKF